MLSILVMFLLIFLIGILAITAGEYAIDWLRTYIEKKSEQMVEHNSQQS